MTNAVQERSILKYSTVQCLMNKKIDEVSEIPRLTKTLFFIYLYYERKWVSYKVLFTLSVFSHYRILLFTGLSVH